MKRSTLLGSLGSGAAALALPLPAFAADDGVSVGIMNLDSAMESTYAQRIGYADQAHLRLSIDAMSSGAGLMSAVLGKSLDIASINIFSILQAHDKGLPIVIVASASLYTSKFPTAALVVLKDSPIKSGADLNGKTMAVNALKNMAQVSAMAWADKNGGDSSKIKFVEMPIPEMQIALASKRIDVANMGEPFASSAAKGDARIIASVYDGIATSWLQNALVATTDWVAANPEVARRFRTLVYKTAIWANTHQPQTAEILSDATKVKLDVIHATPRARYAEKDNIELLEPVIEAAVKYGLISKRPNARDLFLA